MSNERMSRSQLETAREILAEVRQRLATAAQNDERFVFLLRRYVSKNLSYDDLGGHPKPAIGGHLKTGQ